MIVKKHWYEERTACGNWSKKKVDYEEDLITEEEYKRFVKPENMWRTDRVRYGYTSIGYLPVRITNNRDYSYRVVWEFEEQ